MPETIADFIKQDLKARLCSGAGLPDKLTLAALSEHYRVSFTPVRLAVRELIHERVLRRQDNGRIEFNALALDRDKVLAPPAPPAESHDAENTLIAEIIRHSLRGESTYLREEVTAERLGVGRTVLRQVLNRLAGQGVIEHLPRRGWRVKLFNEAEMNAYLQVRESLELKALDLARPRLVPADLKRMLRGNRAAPSGERLDNDLHCYLIAKADNGYIRDFFERHGRYYTMLFDFAAPEAQVVRAMARQHRVILRALLAQDWKTARQALARHIRAQRPIVQRLLRALAAS
jgi:DNA-binding GntR family transcriptional regulator